MTKDIFELTFEKAAIGIAHVDTNGKWLRVNTQLCRFLGYSAKELFELTFQDITHQDDLAFDLKHLHQVLRGEIESFNIEKRYIRKDGTLTWGQLSASCVRDSEGKINYFISVIADINEQKQLEYNLKRAEHLAKLGHWTLDLQTNALFWSDEIYTIFEIDQNQFEATYEAFLNAIHPEDREIVNQAYIRSLQTHESYQIVHRLLLNNHKIKFVLEQCETVFDGEGKALSSTGTVQDITRLHETHQMLLESEHFYRTIVSSIDDTILILEDNIIVDCNPASIYLFEKSKQSLIGTNILEQPFCLIESTEQTFNQCLINAYHGNVTHVQCSLLFNRDHKTNKIVEITLANYGNETHKLILIARDITQKLEEEKIFKIHTRQAQMGEMISMIAHQWRQPLAIINALTSQLRIKEMLKEDEDPTLIAQLSKIEQQSLYLSQTISDYRDFFRPDKPLETILLSDLINHALELIDHTIKSKGVTVRHCVNHPVYVDTYRNELIQVIVSLFKNSFDAFDENAVTNRIIQIDIYRDDLYGILSITDNGGGMTKEILDKIFVPYFTTKNHTEGTGLGMYMSRMIIEDHCHGKLDVSSNNNETTINLKLPYTNL
ncbi:PAS domain S-box protein [Sulfuricurvum sp.]|uniref:PAS domain S-box protein n=1 Tax=Sulfuricurvum sp. TaxID=2025608 RepID=UPI002632474F|nr:PAS domain S-box protein [Sulfuricurvum sp.]MDD2782518.1 PAS domain S-box protein [Sulfuricurvum sp.]